MVRAWRNFKKNFLDHFTIIFKLEMLEFHPYSILTGETIVVFVIYYVLKSNNFETKTIGGQYVFLETKQLRYFHHSFPLLTLFLAMKLTNLRRSYLLLSTNFWFFGGGTREVGTYVLS